ncbi:MAG: BfmA/BtgA family mobilization protein, partial [Aureibaculum sp.]|nr:BfmA/BtgA family mobilization protein [Aureibaculum sp.]
NNAVISIMKDIEKTQTKPTNAMMNLLFKEAAEEEEEEQVLLEEVLSDGVSEELFTEQKELEYYRNGYFTGKSSLREVKDEFKKVLDKVDYIKNSFGSNYYRLNVTQQEFEEIIQKLS